MDGFLPLMEPLMLYYMPLKQMDDHKYIKLAHRRGSRATNISSLWCQYDLIKNTEKGFLMRPPPYVFSCSSDTVLKTLKAMDTLALNLFIVHLLPKCDMLGVAAWRGRRLHSTEQITVWKGSICVFRESRSWSHRLYCIRV